MKKVLMLTILTFGLLLNTSTAKGAAKMIEEGNKVKFDYTLTVDGIVIDTSEGKAPLEYVHGQNMIIKGLEREMVGMKVGDEKTVEIASEDAYGPMNPEAVREFPKNIISDDGEPQVGMMIQIQDGQGNTLPAMIMDVREETVILNFNHPLAGKDLTFTVTVVSIE